MYKSWANGSFTRFSRVSALLLIALTLSGYGIYLLLQNFGRRTIQVCVLSDFSFREHKPKWEYLLSSWMIEVNRMYEPAKVQWNFVAGGESYAEDTEGSLAERRGLIEETATCKADVVLGLTGRPDPDSDSSVSPFGHVALVSSAAKSSDAAVAATIARGLGALFGAGVGLPAPSPTAAAEGEVFDPATLKAIRELRWYDFAQGVTGLRGDWKSGRTRPWKNRSTGRSRIPGRRRTAFWLARSPGGESR